MKKTNISLSLHYEYLKHDARRKLGNPLNFMGHFDILRNQLNLEKDITEELKGHCTDKACCQQYLLAY